MLKSNPSCNSRHRAGILGIPINQPTTVKTFNGDVKTYGHYYQIYDGSDRPVKYCKFQQLDRPAKVLCTPAYELPVI